MRIRLGDAFAIVAQPIARGIDYAFGTDIQHCGGCIQRQSALNDFSDAIYDRFWERNTNQGDIMEEVEHILTVAFWAQDAYDQKMIDLVNYIKQQGGSVLAVNLRPPGTQQQMMVPRVVARGVAPLATPPGKT